MVDERASALGYASQTALAAAADIDRALVGRIYSGKEWKMRADARKKLERALGWAAGSIEQIGNGEPPTLLERDAMAAHRLDAVENDVAELRQMVEALAERIDGADVDARRAGRGVKR